MIRSIFFPLGNSVVTDVQFGHLLLVCIKDDALQEVICGLFRKISPCSWYILNNIVFQLPFHTKQGLERAVTDVRREIILVIPHSFAADSV